MHDSSPNSDAPRLSAIVLAFGSEPDLPRCLTSLRTLPPSVLEIVLVDNGCTRTDIDQLAAITEALLIRPAVNGGFAGGCNVGASHATGETLVFVNSDAFVEPDCLERLERVVSDDAVGVASACIVLDEAPETVNSIGNPVHVSGLTWAGGYGDPIGMHSVSGSVASATGCVMAIRHSTWNELEGFWSDLFAYLEDTELSVRAWQRGLEVRYVADAVARHAYEFSRNPLKLYLLERNRLLFVLTTYQRRTMVRLLPVLVVFELLMCALALRQGWLREKLRGYGWIARHGRVLHQRRAATQRARRVDDDVILPRFRRDLAPANVELPPGVGALNTFVQWWCRLVLRG